MPTRKLWPSGGKESVKRVSVHEIVAVPDSAAVSIEAYEHRHQFVVLPHQGVIVVDIKHLDAE